MPPRDSLNPFLPFTLPWQTELLHPRLVKISQMSRLKLKGSFFRTLLRSDVGMGAMGLDAVKLAPYGVYVGELKY